jgi:hypothetical protein
MQQIKVCPDCATEYFSHIKDCADCGALLLSHDENRKVQEEKRLCIGQALEDQVVVREGELIWMKELYNVLIDAGIPCVINADAGCNKGCCGGRDRLFVSTRDLEKANERIDQYHIEIHPEMQASQEMVSQGKCPACGSNVDSDAVECQDCGLTLIIIE